MADARQPKGTLHTLRFVNAPVTATAQSKTHGHLWLLGAVLIDRDTVLAFYGRLSSRSCAP